MTNRKAAFVKWTTEGVRRFYRRHSKPTDRRTA